MLIDPQNRNQNGWGRIRAKTRSVADNSAASSGMRSLVVLSLVSASTPTDPILLADELVAEDDDGMDDSGVSSGCDQIENVELRRRRCPGVARSLSERFGDMSVASMRSNPSMCATQSVVKKVVGKP